MDEEESAYDRPRERAQSVTGMSKVPSWISVGLVFGAMVGWYLKPEPKWIAPLPPPAVRETPRAQETKLTTVEAVFAAWGHEAVWERDVTEIAFWNPGTKDFTEFYEVRRAGEALFFRSIPRLTRRVINHGKAPSAECPLLFTETEAQYQEWREHGRTERPVTLELVRVGESPPAAPSRPPTPTSASGKPTPSPEK